MSPEQKLKYETLLFFFCASTHRWPWRGCTKTPMPWEEHITKVMYTQMTTLGAHWATFVLLHKYTYFIDHTHRPPRHTEWNGQHSGGHPAVTGHVPWNQEAVLPSVLLPLQWWSPGDPRTVQKPWGSKNTYWLKHSKTYDSLWWICEWSE